MGHDPTNSRTTQRTKVLRLLIDAHGGWVPAPELASVGGLQFQTRIHEIRHKLRLTVENRKEYRNGQQHSWYRLTTGSTTTLAVEPQPGHESEPGPVTLFGDLRPWRDPEER